MFGWGFLSFCIFFSFDILLGKICKNTNIQVLLTYTRIFIVHYRKDSDLAAKQRQRFYRSPYVIQIDTLKG